MRFLCGVVACLVVRALVYDAVLRLWYADFPRTGQLFRNNDKRVEQLEKHVRLHIQKIGGICFDASVSDWWRCARTDRYQKYLSEFERSFGALDLTKAGSRGTSVIPSWHAHHECLACTERIHSTHLVPAADTPTAVKCRYCSGRYHLRCLLTPLARTQMKSWACEPCISSHRAPSSSDTAAHNEGSNVANSAGEDEGHDDGGTRKKARLDHSKDPTSVASSAVLVEAVSNEVLSVCFL